MIRKEVHLDQDTLNILKQEAQKQNRSLKNYLEHLAIEQAKKLQTPSPQYMEMMDQMLEDFDNEKLNFSSLEDILKKNGIQP